ncbi:MAG: hypothetical protein ABF586_12395 [Sporolactobacillus sp.]
MAKGKRFMAAQKHFSAIELSYRQQINLLTSQNEDLQATLHSLSIEHAKLKHGYDDLQNQFTKLQAYAKLSEDDLSRALENDRAVSMLSSLVRHLNI